MATLSGTSPGSTADSLDPDAGGTYRGKPIWDLGTIEENLNRTGYDWYTNNYGELNDGVLSFGFWQDYRELTNSYYVSEDGTIAFNEAYYGADFSPFNAEQTGAAIKSIGLWNDLVDIDFVQTLPFRAADADIVYGNTYTGGAQAYAYLPFGNGDDKFYKDNYGFDEAGRLGGDVWIDGFVASNFFPIQNSYYAITTLIHETGHALGLSHPGDYNALDPDGNPVPVTYVDQAEYAQDSLQYSIMSYFDGYETGAQFIDFNLLNFAYPSTPMIHDIAAIQEIYGADYTTRAGDTVYGFHSTETGTAYDFTANTRPVLSIWDGDGNDTLNFSQYTTNSKINLNAGTFSSAGGADHFATLDEVNANRAALGFAPRTQDTYDYYQDLIKQLGVTNPQFKDNISIAYGVTIENAVGGSGNDTIIANNVANSINGHAGEDTVSYETATSGVTILLRGNSVADAGTENAPNGAAGDKLIAIEDAIGSKFGDSITGNAQNNTFDGLGGDDVLNGKSGSDTYVFRNAATSGHDTIVGFGSDDLIATQTRIAGVGATGGRGGIPNADGVIVIDRADGDSITFTGHGADEGLKFVGKYHGLFYYAALDSDVTPDAINKLNAPADTLAETDAKTAAQVAAAKAPDQASIDLTQRAEGYTGQSNAHFGEGNSQFSGSVSINPDTGNVANLRAAFVSAAGHADAGFVGVNFGGLSHLDAGLHLVTLV